MRTHLKKKTHTCRQRRRAGKRSSRKCRRRFGSRKELNRVGGIWFPWFSPKVYNFTVGEHKQHLSFIGNRTKGPALVIDDTYQCQQLNSFIFLISEKSGAVTTLEMPFMTNNTQFEKYMINPIYGYRVTYKGH